MYYDTFKSGLDQPETEIIEIPEPVRPVVIPAPEAVPEEAPELVPV